MKRSSEPSRFAVATIDNRFPRRDLSGEVIDAHDGCLMHFEDRYWLYGTGYGDQDGFGAENRCVVYSSPDLEAWTFEGDLLDVPAPAVARGRVRPYVIRNERTGTYVMWFQYVDDRTGRGVIACAVAPRPAGPFTIVDDHVTLRGGGLSCGDLGLLVDTDGVAYLAFASEATDAEIPLTAVPEPIPHHQIVVERLDASYTASAGEWSEVIAGNCEAPALFRRGDTYHLLFDNTCAYCELGTGVRVYTASSPLGPYAYHGNANVADPAAEAEGASWTMPGVGRPDAVIPAQQTHVARLPGPEGEVLLWMGDLWGSAPDGVKGHDLQHWEPLEFDDAGAIRPLRRRATCTVEVAVAGSRDC